MTDRYASCLLCPRSCGVNRRAGETGFCGETSGLRIAAAVIHKGEEPPLVGTGGSGTIFISGCNLGCVFCQNYQVSHSVIKFPAQGGGSGAAGLGRVVSPEEFAAICAALRDNGAENINIVTGSHAIPALIEGFEAARKTGVLAASPASAKLPKQIPVLWNCSAYETPAALELLENYVDIYLPDLKTLDATIAEKFFNAPDYPSAAKEAILKMIEITNKKEQLTENRVIIRHLILPGYLESTRSVLRWFADNAKGRALLSLMTQYTPIPGRGDTAPKRYLLEEEYETVMKWLDDFGIEDGFCQELVTGNEWLPDFKRSNPFPSKLSVPVWTFS